MHLEEDYPSFIFCRRQKIIKVEAWSNTNRCAFYHLITRSSNESTLLSIFSSVVRELENLLSPAAMTSRAGVEVKLTAIIDIASSSKMEHISTTGIGGASTTVPIPIHHICVGERYDVGSGNGNKNSDNSMVSSPLSSYWG